MGNMAADVVGEILRQLEALPSGTSELDLLIASQGGDPTVAWRIVSLIRERVRKFSALVPQAAFSAATLLALGADEIVMHPNGNLGPVDPQVSLARPAVPGGPPQVIQFGYQDLRGLLEFARETVGLNDQSVLNDVLGRLCAEIGSLPVGVATRGARLAVAMSEKLLRMHLPEDKAGTSAKAISEALNEKFFHHGYPVSRREARELGLNVPDAGADVEKLLWAIWLDLEAEMAMREPWTPMGEVARDPAAAMVFSPAPQVNIPQGLPPQAQAAMLQSVMQQIGIVFVPPVKYSTIHAVVESTRAASRFVIDGTIFAARQADLQVRLSVMPVTSQWRDVVVT